jgi:hypothetical protein
MEGANGMPADSRTMEHGGTSICTLFEGRYHYGLGALVNSLYEHGYRGAIYAGFRGSLPPWASPLSTGPGYSEYRVAEGCSIRFIELTTPRHLAGHKPDFLLDLWENRCGEAKALFYFDPDIVIKCRWSFYEEWVQFGVALCEDLNSPLNPTHPLRLGWKRFFASQGVNLNSNYTLLVNSGFIGVAGEHLSFLREWSHILELMSPHADGLRRFPLGDRTHLFQMPDQDALNIALYSTRIPVSVIGKEGMDFIPGGYTMSHAAGAKKPWVKAMLLSALNGVPPSTADKSYWKHVRRPVRLYSGAHLLFRQMDMRFGAAIGRLLRRA